jgi:hypothetical protein
MASNFAVVYDACVLYPAALRDVLVQLATTRIFRAKWTDRIHDEWIRNLLVNRPELKADRLERFNLLEILTIMPDWKTRKEYLDRRIEIRST